MAKLTKEEAKTLFRKWKKLHSDPIDERYFVGGKSLSANMLGREIERETNIGLGYIESMIDLSERGVNLEDLLPKYP